MTCQVFQKGYVHEPSLYATQHHEGPGGPESFFVARTWFTQGIALSAEGELIEYRGVDHPMSEKASLQQDTLSYLMPARDSTLGMASAPPVYSAQGPDTSDLSPLIPALALEDLYMKFMAGAQANRLPYELPVRQA